MSGPPCRHQGRPAAKWGGPLTKWMNACKSVSRTRHRLNGTRKVLGGWSRTPRRAPETGHGTRTVDTVGTQGPSTTSCAATRRSSRIRIAHERSSKACRASAIIFDILSPLVGRKCRPPLATRFPSSPFKTSIFFPHRGTTEKEPYGRVTAELQWLSTGLSRLQGGKKTRRY